MAKWLWVMTLGALVGAASAQEPPATADGPQSGGHTGGPSPPSPALVSQVCKIDLKGDRKDQWIRLPKAESSVTQRPGAEARGRLRPHPNAARALPHGGQRVRSARQERPRDD